MKYAHPAGRGDQALYEALKRLVNDLNKSQDAIAALPAFADDAAAQSGGVAVNSGYRADDGSVRWRVA